MLIIELQENYPWEYQLPENLVYCGILEHHVLTYKIWEQSIINGSFNNDVYNHLFNWIIPELINHFGGTKWFKEYRGADLKTIDDKFSEFLLFIRYIIYLQIHTMEEIKNFEPVFFINLMSFYKK